MQNLSPRRLFIAGSTGATGRTLMGLAEGRAYDLVPHLRPKTAEGRTLHPQAAVLDLGDSDGLAAAMLGCTTLVQLIGTMRKRFASGDTYETSDIGTTRHLMSAAKACGIDHVVLLSSVGAGNPRGSYLKAKAEAEALVLASGIDATIFRPSAFVGAGHRPIPGMALLTSALGMERFRPIPVEVLAATILWTASTGAERGQILEGASLWRAVDQARAVAS